MGDSDIKSELAGISATLKGMAGTLEKIDFDIRSVKSDHQGILKTVSEHGIKIENIEKDVDALWASLRTFKNWVITLIFTTMASTIAWLLTLSGVFK